MTRVPCVGLVGGLGVGATMHYYEKLARMHDAQHRILDLVMVHTQMSRVFEYVEVGDHFGLAEYLVGFLYRLKAAGADFAVIPAVTPHFCLKELIAVSPLHLMSIFDPVVKQLAIQKARRVAIFERASSWNPRSLASLAT